MTEFKLPEKVVLDNGITIISEKIPGALACSLSIWINAGSVHEDLNNNGISHFIEHVVFKGSKSRTALDLAEESENVGANLNAFTDRENTCFHTMVLSEYALIPLELFLDMLFNTRLDNDDFELERHVILEEIKMYKDTPEDLAQDKLYEIFWKDHPMGRPITGIAETITNLKREDVFNYLNKLYTPDNIVISLAGEYDLDKVIKKTEEMTKGLKRKLEKKDVLPLQITPSIFIEDKDIEQAYLSFATKGTSIYEEDRYTLAVIDTALGNGSSSRLFQEIREKRGLAYTISSYYHTNKLGGLFGIYAATTGNDSQKVLDLVLKELNSIKKHGLKKDELERSKMQLRTSLLIELESSKVRAFRNALYELYYKRFLSVEEINNSIQSITNENIIKLSEDIFDPKYFTLVVVGPKRNLPKEFKLS
jgi:predicted Zn-dependent peptidase